MAARTCQTAERLIRMSCCTTPRDSRLALLHALFALMLLPSTLEMAAKPGQISRELLNGPADPRGLCRDAENKPYSPGALVPLRREPGRAARCADGTWVEASR